jgi:hypothetical protein
MLDIVNLQPGPRFPEALPGMYKYISHYAQRPEAVMVSPCANVLIALERLPVYRH